MTKPISGLGLTAVTMGGVLVYAGFRGYSVLAVMANLVTGKPITTDVKVVNPLSTPGTTTTTTDTTTSYNFGSPRLLAQQMAASRGWTGVQWTALEKLWDKESNFNPLAKNPSSGAYGIPQALPYTKMPKAAWPKSAGGTSDAQTQIQWGLDYIAGRYKTPANAWAHSQQTDWY